MTAVIVGVVALIAGAAAGFLVRSSMARSSATTLEDGPTEARPGRPEALVASQEDAAQTLQQGDRRRQRSTLRRSGEMRRRT